MVKKSQLRKYTVQKIMELVATETNGEALKMFGEAIVDKNKPLLEKKTQLLQGVEETRKSMEKVFREMNDGVKDRIQLKSKTVMDKQSRPTPQDIGEVTHLFTYIQNQFNLINRNRSDLIAESAKLAAAVDTLKPKAALRADTTDLDEQYFQLHEQCGREEEVRDGLAKERETKLRHYGSIASSIEQCRVEYELVEGRIREKERELVQLMAYFEARKKEDERVLSDLRETTADLENELLKAQQILNSNSSRCEGLMIKQIESVAQSQ